MTTLAHRDETALVVIDFQVGVVAAEHRRGEGAATISRLVDRARHEGALAP